MKDKDAEGCIDDLIQEAALRGLGNIDAEVKKMRDAIAGEKSVLLAYVEAFNIDGIKDCLRCTTQTGDWNKALVCAVDAMKAPCQDNAEKIVAIM